MSLALLRYGPADGDVVATGTLRQYRAVVPEPIKWGLFNYTYDDGILMPPLTYRYVTYVPTGYTAQDNYEVWVPEDIFPVLPKFSQKSERIRW